MSTALLPGALVALAGLPLLSSWAPVGAPAWHLPLAVALALVHWAGPRCLPALAAGLAAAYALAGQPLAITLTLAGAGAAAAGLSWLLFARLADGRCWLPDLRHLVAFLLLGLLAPLALHSSVLALHWSAAADLPADWARTVVAVTAAGFTACTIVTVPALVFASRPLAQRGWFAPPEGWRALPVLPFVKGLPNPEMHAVAAAALFVGALVPCLFPSDDTTRVLHQLFLLAVPLRFGMALAVLAVAWSALLTLYLPEPLASPGATSADLVARTQPLLLIALRGVVGLVLGRATADARRADAEVRALNAGLEDRVRGRTAELLRNESRYRALFDASSGGIILADAADGCCLECNAAAARLLGAGDRTRLIGRRPGDRPLPVQPTGEDTAGLFARMFARAREEGSSRFDWLSRTYDGVELHVEVFCTALEIDGRPLIQVVMNDITARKAAEEALRRSEQRLALAVEAANQGLWDWHLATDEVYFSDGWYQMLGYRPGEAPMSVRTWLELIHPDDVEPTRDALEAALKGQVEEYAAEFRMRCKSGAWKWVQTRGRVLTRDAEGCPLRIAGTHSDIDGFKRTQQELHAAREVAEAAARAERELVARLSHELRTPLNGVIGPVDLLARTALDAAQRRYVELARSSAGILLALVDDVLHLQREEAPEATRPERAAAAEGLRGRRVLIVEDNRINAEIARAVLGGAGLHCTVAGDGAAGVAAFERGDYDLVLMDCYLPVFDGPEAARRIRALPGRRRVPIVALTATATPENREACAEAGMDEYLCKPFDAPVLLRVIERLLNGAWSREVALERLGGREALLAKVAGQFLAGRAEAVAEVRRALAAGDGAALRAAAHRLKGQAGTFEARSLVEAAGRLEDAAKRGAMGEAPELAARLEAELGRLAPELEAFVAGR